MPFGSHVLYILPAHAELTTEKGFCLPVSIGLLLLQDLLELLIHSIIVFVVANRNAIFSGLVVFYIENVNQ